VPIPPIWPSSILYGVLGRCLEALCGCKIIACADAGAGSAPPVSFDAALVGAAGTKLCGTPTYRMPRHPDYKDMFTNPMYKPIWFKAFGLTCFTRLVRRQARQQSCALRVRHGPCLQGTRGDGGDAGPPWLLSLGTAHA
jgi:hypothetical protein